MEGPIGVFDSGVGGLTVLRELVRALPGETFLYLGDTARVPYGTKSRETVTRYAIEIANHLITAYDIRMLVVACNTASSLALPSLHKIYRIPLVGMVDPCARRAASLAGNARIGVIGTASTIRSGAYEQALRRALPDAKVTTRACPLLVSLVEEGWADKAVTRAVIEEYLSPFRETPQDALILGCTHYPVLKERIAECLPGGTVLIDSGEEAARAVGAMESGEGRTGRGNGARIRFLVTDDPERFARVGETIFGRRMEQVEKITL